ncbi:glycoside hydrolase family 68 protein [Sphingomonas sp. RB3P16]|uniref:glycoside hydrolase family 68 protein n=1 Tax=Parasphingomonas frigoris TaxID=3096163 RepID=UPI002FCB1C18
MTTIWSRDAVAAIALRPIPEVPRIAAQSMAPVLPGYDLWDYWPLQERDGRTAEIAGGALQMLLSAPVLPDPESRHGLARIRLMHETPHGWRDLGDLLPDGFAPGSREWSGSAIVTPQHDRVTLYFTAAGHRGEAEPGFDQRLFETSATLSIVDVPRLTDWSVPVESVAADGQIYARDMTGGGAIGTIKAFRDPAWFCDPADGAEYLIFAASLAQSSSPWNGAVGVARRRGGQWTLEPPLITADGVNNELERPHLVHHDQRYYCFWSTQRKVFADGGPSGPTGLYGMVAESLAGPWAPLNGTGLVCANPPSAPMQAYSWLVLGDLSVISFVDRPDLPTDPIDPVAARRVFGGTPARPFRILLAADRATVA